MADSPAKASGSAANRWTLWQVLKQTFTEFGDDKCPRLGAALAYYTIFSIAPLLVIAVGVVGWVTHNKHPDDPSQSPVVKQVTQLVGNEGGEAIGKMVAASAKNKKGGVVATIVGAVTLLFGASGVFGQLQDALNTIWKVAPKPGQGVWGFIRQRFLSFAMVAGICFLLLVSLVVSTVLSAIGHFGGGGHVMHYVWAAVNFVVSLVVISALFAMMFKVLPDVKMNWRDTLIGAVATAVLFGVGKWAIGMYLGKAGVSSSYGAVGSAVVLLLWVYYSSQIFLLGAEFTQVYACRMGSKYKPDEKAVSLTPEMRAQQGIPTSKTVARLAGQPEPQPPVSGHGELVEPGNVALLERHRAARQQARADAQQPTTKALPATLGFAAGFVAGRMAAPKPKVKRLVLAPGVRISPKWNRLPSQQATPPNLWRRFRKGWEQGVDDAK